MWIKLRSIAKKLIKREGIEFETNGTFRVHTAAIWSRAFLNEFRLYYVDCVVTMEFSSSISLITKTREIGKSVADGAKQKASRKRALVMSVAYFWLDFVEAHNFAAGFTASSLMLPLLDNTGWSITQRHYVQTRMNFRRKSKCFSLRSRGRCANQVELFTGNKITTVLCYCAASISFTYKFGGNKLKSHKSRFKCTI